MSSLEVQKSIPSFTSLPTDILKIIDSYLSREDLIALHTTCKFARTKEMLESAFVAHSKIVSTIVRHELYSIQNDAPFLTQNSLLQRVKDAVKALNLFGCRLPTERLSGILQFFSNLQSIDLRSTATTNKELDLLATFPKLQKLKLPETVLAPDNEKAFDATCKNLTALHTLWFAKDVNRAPGYSSAVATNGNILSSLPSQLKKLRFFTCTLTDNHIQPLEKFTCLEKMRIENTSGQFKSAGLNFLPISLRSLDLRRCRTISDAALPLLQRLENLTELRIVECPSVTGTTFASLPSNLIALHCDLCIVSQQGIDNLNSLPKLQVFSLKVSATFFATLNTLPSTIRDLTLHKTFCGSIAHLTQLQSLNIDEHWMRESTITGLPTTLKKLSCNSMSIGPRIQPKSFMHAMSLLSQLEEVRFTCWPEMVELHTFEQFPTSLRRIELRVICPDTSGIPPSVLQVMEAFNKARPACVVTLCGAQTRIAYID